MRTNILLGMTLAISTALGAPATSGSTSLVDRRELINLVEGRGLFSSWLDQWRNGGAATTTTPAATAAPTQTATQTPAPPAQTTTPGNTPANPAGCPDHEILFARGTGEPGPFGTIVGDPLMERVNAALPGAEGYAVDYPASSSFSTSVPVGVSDVISRLESQSSACPGTTFALVGYSQGGMVMHGVFADGGLDSAIIPKIKALVMFGDPYSSGVLQAFPASVKDRVLDNCADGDPVCGSGGNFAAHTSYNQAKWQDPSAEFIVSRL